MRCDPAVPHWARALLSAIAVLQLAAIHLARPIYLPARELSTARQTFLSLGAAKNQENPAADGLKRDIG